MARRTGVLKILVLIINHDNGTRRLGPVLGSWVGARHRLPPFLIPTRAPRGFTQDPSTVTTPLLARLVRTCAGGPGDELRGDQRRHDGARGPSLYPA